MESIPLNRGIKMSQSEECPFAVVGAEKSLMITLFPWDFFRV